MNRTAHLLIFLGLLLAMTGLAYGLNCLYLTEHEITRFGDRIRFMTGDTLDGPVHSNDQIAIQGSPVFTDVVSSCAPDFWRGVAYAPRFMGPDPVFNAPRVTIATDAFRIRRCASNQGHFYAGIHDAWTMELDGTSAHIYHWTVGGDPAMRELRDMVPLSSHLCMFFEGPLHVSGLVLGHFFLGSASDIYIEDNLRYVDSNPLTGVTPATSDNYLVLSSESNIKVANTPANGRENSDGLGLFQTNPDLTSVVITGALYALNESFTFEQQNDADSGYVCDCSPDDRGTIYVYGGVAQMRRGYFHRASRGSTGYLKHLRFDPRLRRYDTMMDPPALDLPDSINFGDIPLGSTVWDTLQVRSEFDGYLGSVQATSPFWAERIFPFQGFSFQIPVRFAPPHLGHYEGRLYVTISSVYREIPIYGRGVPAGAPPIALGISPNPFNLTATIRYSLPAAGPARLTIYDLLGRAARTFDLSGETPARMSCASTRPVSPPACTSSPSAPPAKSPPARFSF